MTMHVGKSKLSGELGAVRAIVCEVWNLGSRAQPLRPEDLPAEGRLFDVDRTGGENLGFDSLDAMELVLRLEEEFGVTIPDDLDPHDFMTPARIAALVVRLAGEGDTP